MGFTDFLGSLAKGFAEGYIEERGVKGTVEDVADIAKSIFSSDDDDENSNDFISEYNALIDAAEYAEAYDYVNAIYEGEDKDDVYYYLCANALNYSAINTDCYSGLKLIEQAITFINKAWKKTDKGTGAANDIKELKETIYGNKEELNKQKKMIEHWDETLEKIDQLCGDSNFAQAEKILLDHYREYENGTLDYFYWRNLAQIHYFKHFESKTYEENEATYQTFIRDLDQASKFIENDAERAAEISNWRNWDKNVIQPSSNVKNTTGNIASQSSNEAEYVAEIRAFLEDDGKISDRERRLLNKLRQSLGISEKRAAELEASLQSNLLTPEEQEYADEVKACFEDDGVISPRERRLLDKVRNSLGITTERANEIEAMVKAQS